MKTYAVKAIENTCGNIKDRATNGEKGPYDFHWTLPCATKGIDINSAYRVLEKCNATLPHWQLCGCKFEVIEL